MNQTLHQSWLTRLSPWMALLAACVLAGCLPDRRDGADAGAGTSEDAVDDASDATPTTGDAKGDLATSDAKDAGDAVEPEDVPQLGCKKDDDCAGLADACRAATCTIATGLCAVTLLPDDTTCTGATDACIESSHCKAGACVASPLNCADDKPCTVDACKPDTGCDHVPIAAVCGADGKQPCLCDDGDACTTNDACNAGFCAGSTKDACNDFNPCTEDACANKACTHQPVADKSACDDGHWCTENDGCQSGVCTGTARICPSEGECIAVICADDLKLCAQAPLVGQACDDGDPCTTGDACDDSGQCVAPKGCDDGNACTDDACQAGVCKSTNNTAACVDAEHCISSGQCASGKCTVGGSDGCDDGNACTSDSCDVAAKKCVHVLYSGPCSDGDACTTVDTCSAGACIAVPANFDDGNECTIDACDPLLGPSYTPSDQTCSTGSCIAATCVAQGNCGDGVCGLSEATGNCPADCPASGGTCAELTGKCVEDCAPCSDARAICESLTDPGGCAEILTCENACSTAACRLACVLGKEPLQVRLWLNVDACRAAFCEPDDWLGKPCDKGSPNFQTCRAACEGAMAFAAAQDCLNTPGCTAHRACLEGCGVDAVCVAGCTASAAAAKAATAINAQSDLWCM